jgi:hypothetical protein
MNKKEISKQSPKVEGYGEKMAFYSVGCCWWTSFPEDLGKSIIPCCPHCGAPLFQAPLKDFIKMAESNPGHYGEHGIETFYKAHHRNSTGCHKEWEDYWAVEEK